MHLSEFDYDLPEHFIAQTPLEPRDSSKLLLLNRQTGAIQHTLFRNIVDHLRPGDVLVMNTTRVIPARLFAQKNSGGKAELLLLRPLGGVRWQVLVGGRRITTGTRLTFPNHTLYADVVEELEGSERVVAFSEPIQPYLDQLGETPLPPYIHSRLDDAERYQTIYSRHEGSAAAPTAGLHFTPEVLFAAKDKGVQLAYCTLHIGLDTFQPVREETIENHLIHSERASLSAENAEIINRAKLAGGRIIAVGTTTARTLETAAILSAGGDPADPSTLGDLCPWRPVTAFDRDTRLFIYPGFRWRAVNAIITNFHLPKSSLLMMISSFAGREQVLKAYETAKQESYRFFSFGDAMFIS